MAETLSVDVRDWLVGGDAAIRWQTSRDLLGADRRVWGEQQEAVATTGWGARLLAERSNDGKWAGGLYTPKWKSTTYTLLLLWRMGLPHGNALARESTQLLMNKPIWLFGSADRPYWEACVAGFALSLSSWFDVDRSGRERLLGELLTAQLPDGGWNCRSPRGATHSSFHTTINVLEGLREYCISGGHRRSEVEVAEARAREFFNQHRLYRSHRTGRVPDDRMAHLPFPPRWHHDILRGLDYYRAADAERDSRLEDAIEVLGAYRRRDDRWPLHSGYSGQVWFQLEADREPSRWNTLRALRVLNWWTSSTVELAISTGEG